MILRDFHVHTAFCDGDSTPEEVVVSAIDKGMECIGICVHSYTFFDESYCVKRERIEEYKAEIARLKEKYSGEIRVLCGVEQDRYSAELTDGFDYVIGSVHYIKVGNEYFSVDDRSDILTEACEKYYGGDIYALIEDYYKTVAECPAATNPNIIGHIDLITKFNENGVMFDENNERYIAAYKSAVDKLIEYNIPFEINTGAISRGYRTKPYPSQQILNYIRSKGGKTIMSSDSHHKDTLMYEFDKWEHLNR